MDGPIYREGTGEKGAAGMGKTCSIVRDLLPLYAENMVSEDTAAFVEEHLAECPDCKAELARMRETAPLPEKLEAAPLKRLKRDLFRKRLMTASLAILLTLVLTISLFAYLTAPQYLPYHEGLFKVTVFANDVVMVTVCEETTAVSLVDQIDPETGEVSCEIEAWYSPWDKLLSNKHSNFSVGGSALRAVYYNPNDGGDLPCVYSPVNDYREKPLFHQPQMGLAYGLAAAGGILLVLALFRAVFRKRDWARWLNRGMLVSGAYIAGHLCIKGFSVSTFSLTRDLSLIALVAVLLACAAIILEHLLRIQRDQ